MSKKLFNQFICSRMMLPEHRERLNNRHQEQCSYPRFDEQQWEEFQFLLSQSFNHNLPIEITLLTEKGQLKATGVVKKIDTISKQIIISTEQGQKKISAKEIAAIKAEQKHFMPFSINR